MGSMPRLSGRRGEVEASGVQAIPQPFKNSTGERLFQVEVDDLAISRNAKFVWLGIRNRLNIDPPPTPAVAPILGEVFDTVVLQAESAIAPAGPHAVVRGNLDKGSALCHRHTVAHWFAYAVGELGCDLGRHRLTQSEAKRPLARFMPGPVLISQQRQFPLGQIKCVDLAVVPAVVEFGGSKFDAVPIEQQRSGLGFLQTPMPLRRRLPLCRLCRDRVGYSGDAANRYNDENDQIAPHQILHAHGLPRCAGMCAQQIRSLDDQDRCAKAHYGRGLNKERSIKRCEIKRRWCTSKQIDVNLDRRWWKRCRNKRDTEGQHRRPMTGGFRKQQMVCRGNRILAAIVRICGGDAFALEATIHRLAGSHIGEAVKWADQQYDCQQTDNDLNAAPHFYLQAYHQFDARLRHSSRRHGYAKLALALRRTTIAHLLCRRAAGNGNTIGCGKELMMFIENPTAKTALIVSLVLLLIPLLVALGMMAFGAGMMAQMGA